MRNNHYRPAEELSYAERLHQYLLNVSVRTGHIPTNEALMGALRVSQQRLYSMKSTLRKKGYLLCENKVGARRWVIDGHVLTQPPINVRRNSVAIPERSNDLYQGVPVRRFEAGTLDQMIQRAADLEGLIVYRSMWKPRGKPWHLRKIGAAGPSRRMNDKDILIWLDQVRIKHGLEPVAPSRRAPVVRAHDIRSATPSKTRSTSTSATQGIPA